MRTCPNCGKDTSAETTQPCTKCGFSPSAPVDIGTTNYGGDLPSGRGLPTRETTDYGLPDEEPAPVTTEARGNRIGSILVILLVIGYFGFDLIGGLFDGSVKDIFESDTGPAAAEVEEALTGYAAAEAGLLGAVVSCPEDTEETELDATFECTVTAPSGASRSVTVTNREDEFEWDGRPFFQLRREEAVP